MNIKKTRKRTSPNVASIEATKAFYALVAKTKQEYHTAPEKVVYSEDMITTKETRLIDEPTN